MSEAKLDGFVAEIRRCRPRMLFGYPSALTHIARHAEKRGVALNDLGIKVAFVTSERLYDEQRSTISRVFGCPVANGYGGRKLQGDDVVDKGLAVIFGSALGNNANVSPGLVTDNVDANDKAHGDVPILQKDFVASAARVFGRFGVVEHDLTRRVRGGLQPKCDRERIGASEMSKARKGEAVVAIELDRFAAPAFDQERTFVSVPRFGGINAVGDFAVFNFIE